MSASLSLEAILGKKAADVKPPAILPPGGYIWRILDYVTDRPAASGTPAVRFNCQAEMAHDIDPTVLADAGVEFPHKMEHAFYITENSLFRLKEFLEKDLMIAENGRTIAEMLPETQGKLFRGNIIHRPGSGANAGKFFPNMSETHPAD